MPEKFYKKEFLKLNLKKCAANTPMPFAFGDGGDPDSHLLVLHPTKIGKALFVMMKKEKGVSVGTWGTARLEDKVLIVDCEKKLPGAVKKLKQFVKANKPLPFSIVKIMVDGVEVNDEDQDVPADEPTESKEQLDQQGLDKMIAQFKELLPQSKQAIKLRPDKKAHLLKLAANANGFLKAKDVAKMEEALHAFNNAVIDILDSEGQTGTEAFSELDKSVVDERMKELVPKIKQARGIDGADMTRVNKVLAELNKTWTKGPKNQASLEKTIKLIDLLGAEVEKVLSKPFEAEQEDADKEAYEKLLATINTDRRIEQFDPGTFAKLMKEITTLAEHGNYKQAIKNLQSYIPQVTRWVDDAEALTKSLLTEARIFDEAGLVVDNPTTHSLYQAYHKAQNDFDDLIEDKSYGRAISAYPVLKKAAKDLTRLGNRLTGQSAALETNAKVMPDPAALKLGKNEIDRISSATDRGGTKGHGKYFKRLLKEMKSVDKDHKEKNVNALEKAALAYMEFDSKRAAKARKKGREPEVADTITQEKLNTCKQALKMVAQYRAHSKYSGQMNELTDTLPPPPAVWPDDTVKAVRDLQMKMLTEFPTELGSEGAKPPSGKGDSDSFFVNGPDGNPMFIYKTKEGENVKPGEKEGMGVAREMLSSNFNDLMSEKVGLDFGFAKATFAQLDCDGFNNDVCASDATSRSGVLLEAIPNEGSLEDMKNDHADELAQIPDNDVQKILLMDFITLQGDRNAENVLIQPGEDGEKRLRPIDGGFAFPSKELFEDYRFGMPGSSLASLPAADKPFTKEMQESLDNIDPDELANGMLEANKKLPSELQGLIEDESIEMMKRSVMFLKSASKKLTPKEVATLYETEFPKVLKASPDKLAAAIDLAVTRGLDFRYFDKAKQSQDDEFETLGGNPAIYDLGYNPAEDKLLNADVAQKINILKNQTPAGNPPDHTTRASLDNDGKQQAYDQMGGDDALLEGLKRKDTKLPVPNFDRANIAVKYGVLVNVHEYGQLGGDAEYNRMVENWDENRYMLFEQLDNYSRICRAAFADCRFSPAQEPIYSKCDILQLLADRG